MSKSKKYKNLNSTFGIGVLCIILLAIFNISTIKKINPKIMFLNISKPVSDFQNISQEELQNIDEKDNSMQIKENGLKNELFDIQQSSPKKFTNPDFPVDVVYTWVNGSDPAWIMKKDEAMKSHDLKIAKRAQAGRYIDIGELKYSLRCVEKFLPWVHKIYILTDNQFPCFLKKHQSKIEIISHDKVISKEFLPTFNSNNIDFHLHLIPNLTEHFIYLNDDVFISRPLQKYNFFNEEGKPILPVARFNWINQRKSIEKMSLKHWVKNDMGSVQYNLITMHTVDVFEKKYNFSVNFKSRHGYIPLTISIMNSIWRDFNKDLKHLETHTFRSFQDIQLPTLLIQVGIGLNYTSILHTSESVRYLVMTSQFTKNLKNFNSSEYDSFCLNSGEKTSDRMRIAAKNFLQESYPEKSSFEV